MTGSFSMHMSSVSLTGLHTKTSNGTWRCRCDHYSDIRRASRRFGNHGCKYNRSISCGCTCNRICIRNLRALMTYFRARTYHPRQNANTHRSDCHELCGIIGSKSCGVCQFRGHCLSTQNSSKESILHQKQLCSMLLSSVWYCTMVYCLGYVRE